jgi:hypothetical protein
MTRKHIPGDRPGAKKKCMMCRSTETKAVGETKIKRWYKNKDEKGNPIYGHLCWNCDHIKKGIKYYYVL